MTAMSAAVLVTGCGGGGGDDSSNKYTPYPAPPISEEKKQAFLNAVNEARSHQQDCGKWGIMPPAPPVQWSDALYRAAAEHSYDMAANDMLSHNGSGTETDWTAQQMKLDRGSRSSERVKVNGGGGLGNGTWENVAEVHSSNDVSAAIRVWLNSDGHCYGLMLKGQKWVGIAQYGSYWTQDFATE